MSGQPIRNDPGERDGERYRPRWWWFALFGLTVLVHLPMGWDSSAAIGLPLGFAVTLVLVFVPDLPRWLTWRGAPLRADDPDDPGRPGEPRNLVELPDSGGRKRSRPRPVGRWCLAAVAVAVVLFLAGAMVAEPPEPDEVSAAVGVWVVAAVFLLFSVGWLLLAFRAPRAVVPSKPPRGFAVRARIEDGDTRQWDWTGEIARARLTLSLRDGRRGYLILSEFAGPLARAVVRDGKLWLSGERLDGDDPGGLVTVEIGGLSATGLLTTDPVGRVPGRRTRPRGASLALLRWQYRLRIPVLVLAGAAVVAVPVAGIVRSGWLWLLLLPALILAGATALWASEIRDERRDVGSGPLTPVDVRMVEDHLWPDREVRAWVVLGPGRPASLYIDGCPPEIAAELVAHHRVWVFGEPRPGPVGLGLPGRGVYTAASFWVR
ncbi:hypothetical protein [Amycolatopsis sp. PS_44_ISF1]|uniref:hypothetical protein n=1 Tax=Amycolatopsis sp. PS_44_ISF1 TaxID=2974917 RepID=UPI0028DE67CA|nr:hypothetical protein [Amycolatopsis sp. PS_44_ISF1]MDT8911177.1 hypothetical protein [Amycolatopsis sp. PS_44_ISF1]